MRKFKYRELEKLAKKKNDIKFNFSEVQTKNPRLQGKTPMCLYVEDFVKPRIRRKKWWE